MQCPRSRLSQCRQGYSHFVGRGRSVAPSTARGYYLEYSGQFEAQRDATFRLWGLAVLSMIGVYLLLMKALGSHSSALQVIANVPLAAFGAIVALLIVNRPEASSLAGQPWFQWPWIWVQSTHLSLAHWVGFITLIGIVSRNGIMMISHYHHLMEVEGCLLERR